MAERGNYDKDGNFKVGGAYSNTGRKVGYDAEDMKKGISDVNKGYGDNPQYLGHENNYLKDHPVVTGKDIGGHHRGTISDNHLTNTHGGVRDANMVRTDIRHGLNMLKESGVTQHGGLLTAERMGYEARRHHYVKAEREAFAKTPEGQRQAANEARAAQPKKSVWDSEPSAPARTAAPAAPAKKSGGLISRLRKK
jgi:hypothetical protein